jgi:predicted dehydrogenase
MPKTYRAALVGTGSIADAHLRAVEFTRGRVQLEAAVDLDQSRVKEFAAKNGIPHAYTDFTAMLAELKPDLVIVATPPGSHVPLSIQAMEAGAWVLCEKPLCGSLAEFDRLAAVEQRTGCRTACVFQMRFASSNFHLHQMLQAGKLGRPLVGVCHTLWYRDAAYYAVPWRGRWSTELGGPTMGHGIHNMDHFLHLMGDWSELTAFADTLDRDIEVEDVSMALVRFANGAMGSIINSALSPRQESFIRLDCQQATVELTHLYGYKRDDWKITVVPTAQDNGVVEAWQGLSSDVGSSHGAQLAAMVADMDQGTCPLTSGPEARRTIEFLTAIYKSAYTRSVVTRGSIGPGDPYYDAVHGHQAPPRVKGGAMA